MSGGEQYSDPEWVRAMIIAQQQQQAQVTAKLEKHMVPLSHISEWTENPKLSIVMVLCN